MNKRIREWIDRLILSNYEWKKKYYPNIYRWLFTMSDDEKKRVIEEGRKNRKVCPTCRGIYFEEVCPECNFGRSCGGYEITRRNKKK